MQLGPLGEKRSGGRWRDGFPQRPKRFDEVSFRNLRPGCTITAIACIFCIPASFPPRFFFSYVSISVSFQVLPEAEAGPGAGVPSIPFGVPSA